MVAAWFGMHRSTISRSIAEISPLLAERGCRTRDGARLRTHSDVVAHLGHHPQALVDATEVRVRRPVAGRAGRDRFVAHPVLAAGIALALFTGINLRSLRSLRADALPPPAHLVQTPFRSTTRWPSHARPTAPRCPATPPQCTPFPSRHGHYCAPLRRTCSATAPIHSSGCSRASCR
ncbi:hypothetical protein [Micromonospora haikouensis]|uniref:hypothetical protein n=1 Tax=Micromonospora haikouensis TaxID=686309 RepID=UPI00378A5D1E